MEGKVFLLEKLEKKVSPKHILIRFGEVIYKQI